MPVYACTGRHVLSGLEKDGRRKALEACGVVIVADTCVVVTPILAERRDGVLMTNSGKFAQYAPGNTGYGVLYGSLADCVESAVSGRPSFCGAWPMSGSSGEILVAGAGGAGEALVLTAPISFWGGVDPKTGRIADVRHPQHGETSPTACCSCPAPSARRRLPPC